MKQNLTNIDELRTDKSENFIDSIILDFIIKNVNKADLPLKTFINNFEERIISTSLKLSNGNQRVAAGLLGVGHTTLNEKIKRYNLKKTYIKIDIIKNIERDFKNII